MITWSSSNFKEILPDHVSEFTNSLVPDLFNDALKAQYEAYGVSLPSELYPLVSAFSYKLFMNISALEWITSEVWKQPPEKLTEMMGGHSVPHHSKPYDNLTVRRHPLTIIRVLGGGLAAKLRQRRAYDTGMSDTARPDNLPGAIDELRSHLRDHLMVGVVASALHQTANDLIARLCAKSGAEPHEFLETPLKAPNIQRQKAWENLISMAHAGATDANLRLAAEDFLRRFGHRDVFEMEVARPRPAEDLDAFLEHLGQSAGKLSSNPAISRQPERSPTPPEFGIIRRLCIRALSRLSVFAQTARERSKSVLASDAFRIRLSLLAVAKEHEGSGLAEPHDVFDLRWDEVQALQSGDLPDVRVIIAARKRKPKPIPPADTFQQESNGTLHSVDQLEVGEVRGTPVSPGVALGTVRVITSHADAHRIMQGDIVVLHALDSGWSEVFAFAGGVVAETGGTMSHAAILLRENRTPAIFNVAGATERLTDGDVVELDGRTGEIVKSFEITKGHGT